jgi:aminopeptidase YwaD
MKFIKEKFIHIKLHMKNLLIFMGCLLILFSKAFISNAQTIDPFYQSIVANVSYDSLLKNLQEFEALGVKEAGSSELNDTRDWILDKYNNYGYTDVQVDTFNAGPYELYNIIITKTGTLYPSKFVIVDGHYDTNSGTGTNDNGSGTSIILETARVLKNISTEYSVKFIHFSGEELGMNGSDHYVNTIVNPGNMNIRIVFNIDEVGGVAGLPNDTLKCESDQSNPGSNDAESDAFTDTLMTLTEMYSSLETIKTNAYGSDYVPFQQNGDIITGYYEYNRSDYVHTSNDFLVHLDTSYVFEIAKASAASTLYFARAYDVSVNVGDDKIPSQISVFPNPSEDNFYFRSDLNKNIKIIIYNMNGEIVCEKDFTGNTSVSLKAFPHGLYFYMLSSCDGSVLKTGILIRKS